MAKGIYSYPDLRMEGFNSASCKLDWGKWDKPKTREIRLGGGWAEDPGLNNRLAQLPQPF